ncbi:MAG: gliding motility protein GldM [Paludibacteraceae bacterium]|nr:gliding motility protein GldM [Paludibacteraceae bacterium]
MGGAKNCPETPRQRMIGMMYLVLTAMLALNVSTDILKAFELVDDSLHATLETTEVRSRQIMHDFLLDSIDNPEKNGPWYVKTLELTQRSDSLYNFIQDFKYDIAVATDGVKKVEAQIQKDSLEGRDIRKVQGSDNRDTPTHYALPDGENKPGVELKHRIEAYREYLISLDTLKREEFNKMFNTDDAIENNDVTTWEQRMFHDMPAGAALVLLTKLQNDIRNAENIMIQHLRRQTDAGDLRVNKLNAYVIPNSRYVIRGGKYSAQIILAAIDSTQTPEYYVDGQRINDLGLYEVVASGLGTKKYSGYISYMNPASGQMEQLPFESEYSVGEPAVTISNTEMNIMYRGYDNKFSISVPGVSNDKVRVSVSGASAHQQGGLWLIKPGDAKTVTISVSAEIDGKMQSMGSKEYSVRPLPKPSAFLRVGDNSYNGEKAIPRSALMNANAVVGASYGLDSPLNLKFTVSSFKANINGMMSSATGNKFTREQMDRIAKLKPGNAVIITDIRVKGPDGREIGLSPIALTLQ